MKATFGWFLAIGVVLCVFLSMLFGPVSVHAEDEASDAEGIVILIHKKNDSDLEELTTTLIKKIFLKKASSFPNDDDAVAVMQNKDCGARKLFLAELLRMSDEALERHWNREKVRSGKTPPKEYSSDSKVFLKITQQQSAIGYVTREYYDALDQKDRDKVRVVKKVEASSGD